MKECNQFLDKQTLANFFEKTKGKNIILIGMPGAGKSTIGVLLAKYMFRNFIDTDVYIQVREGNSLQQIIDSKGLQYFREIEEKYVLSISCENTVIATGGSVIYSHKSMKHLKAMGIMVHLYLPLRQIEDRLTNIDSRGLVISPDQTLQDLFKEREPLYEQYADIVINCNKINHEQVIQKIVSNI